jgi:hypothetical protein
VDHSPGLDHLPLLPPGRLPPPHRPLGPVSGTGEGRLRRQRRRALAPAGTDAGLGMATPGLRASPAAPAQRLRLPAEPGLPGGVVPSTGHGAPPPRPRSMDGAALPAPRPPRAARLAERAPGAGDLRPGYERG